MHKKNPNHASIASCSIYKKDQLGFRFSLNIQSIGECAVTPTAHVLLLCNVFYVEA